MKIHDVLTQNPTHITFFHRPLMVLHFSCLGKKKKEKRENVKERESKGSVKRKELVKA